MRTTVDIDATTMKEVKELARSRHTTLKTLMNEALRQILMNASGVPRTDRYSLPVFHMGRCLPEEGNINKALSLASAMEDAEVAREMELRR